MKKSVIAASAVFCAAMGFADGIQSDVVGYAKTDLQVGFKAVAAQFVSIGKEGVNLTDITFDTADVAKISGELNIQLLDKNGFCDKKYSYYKGQTRGKFTTDGWYDRDNNLITPGSEFDPFFHAGTGLWISGADKFSLTTAGAVLTSSMQFVFEEDGSKLIANPYPVSFKLTDIAYDIAGATKVGGELNIQILDKDGYCVKKYSLYKGQTRGKFTTDGWYDRDNNLIIPDSELVPTFGAGDAIWVTAKTGWSITIAAPKL